jgi:hypothetical protein
MSARGIHVTEHALPGELDDVPPAAIKYQQFVHSEMSRRTRAAYERGLREGRAEREGGMLVLALGLLVGGLTGMLWREIARAVLSVIG